jgi:NAD(P)-dependent dehydrogenase (short-subunit alcohol dehydrogenase family)
MVQFITSIIIFEYNLWFIMDDGLFSVKGKVVIITGGGQGIGEVLALGLSKRGAIVYCIDKKFKKSKNRRGLHDMLCDITKLDKIKSVCSEIIKRNGKIDVLINNAGITMPNNSNNYSLESWSKTLDVNLTGAFLFTQQVLKQMKKNHSGSIINITSINAEFGFPNNPAYIASKGGLKMLGKSLARDWGKYGIRVNNLGPGYILTKMTEKSYRNKKKYAARKANTMLDRWGKTSDLLGPCIFLASDASSYMTGQDIYVDGGWSANGLQAE